MDLKFGSGYRRNPQVDLNKLFKQPFRPSNIRGLGVGVLASRTFDADLCRVRHVALEKENTCLR